jgi:hypothetical protein
MQTRRGLRHALVVAVAMLSVAGLIACGDSDDESAMTGTTSTAAERQDGSNTGDERATPSEDDGGSSEDEGGGATPDGGAGNGQPSGDANTSADEEEQVADTVRGMYRALASSDAKAVCAGMSEQAREQIAEQPPGGGSPAPGEGSCVDSLGRFLGAAAASGVLEQTLKATVTGVEITGPRAVATVSFGGRSGKIRLVKEDGEWRLGAPPSATGAQ